MVFNLTRKKLVTILFLGLACSTLTIVADHWLRIFPQRIDSVQSDGNPVGGDFFAFYNAGKLLKSEPSKLYNLERQWEIQKEQFKDSPRIASSPLPFVYPPLVAVPFVFLSQFEFPTAFLIWAVFGMTVYAISIFVLSRSLSRVVKEHLVFVLIGLGFAPFSTLSIISGHASFFGVFILAGVFAALKSDRSFLAGLILSLSYYKPPLFLIVVLFALCSRDRLLFIGFLLGGVLLTSISIFLIGLPAFIEYLNLLPNYRYGAQVNPGIVFVPKQGAGLLAAITTAMPGHYSAARGIFFIVSALLLGALLKTLKRVKYDATTFNFQFALIASTSLLLSLQMVDYDLSLLIVPLLIVAEAHLRQREILISDVLVLLLLYTAWSYNHFIYREYESYYSAFLLSLWILYCWKLTIGKEARHLHSPV